MSTKSGPYEQVLGCTGGHKGCSTIILVMNLQHRLVLELSVGLSFDQRQAQWRIDLFWQQLQALSARSCTLRGIRSRLALKVEGLARVSKNAGGRPRLASVAFDGRYMG